MRNTLAAGFTLLEITVTLAAAVITLGIGVPVIGNIIAANRVVSQVNALRGALYIARSEAIRRNQQVILCKSSDGQKCTKRASWSQGWIVFEDANQNKSRDSDESLILAHGALLNGHTLDYRGFGSHHYVIYRPTGFTQMNGTFILCAPNSPGRSRALILIKTGRVRLSKTRADGSPLDCGAPINSTT